MKVGNCVTWVTQRHKKEYEKFGTVIAIVPAGADADRYIPPNTPPSRLHYYSAVSEKNDRVLVEVNEWGSTGYYAPEVKNVRVTSERKYTIYLPCEVGNTVYFLEVREGKKKIIMGEVDHITFGWLMKPCIIVCTDSHCRGFESDDFGKVIFLNREEAEEALNGKL